jgi:hypothetical protein
MLPRLTRSIAAKITNPPALLFGLTLTRFSIVFHACRYVKVLDERLEAGGTISGIVQGVTDDSDVYWTT